MVVEELDYLQEKGIIRKSNSLYAFPAFPTGKKGGKIRLVVDFRPLNVLTIADPYPFPEIQTQLYDLNGSKIFSQVDLKTGYYQIQMAEEDIHKTAFVILGQHFEFLRMPFGLTNAPRTFQRAMMNLLGHLQFTKIFLDDILIHSGNNYEHLKHLENIFKIFIDNKISINWEKSRFHQMRVNYLGMEISEQGIKAESTSIKKLQHINLHPKNQKELRQILGLLNWFRPYVIKLSDLLYKLTEKLKGNLKFTWNYEDLKILSKIINLIKNNLTLSHPDFNLPFEVYTDASNIGISCVVCQKGKLIGIYSHKLLPSERNYSIVEKECFALVKGIKHFRTLLYNFPIVIYTDNLNLIHIKDLSSSRWQRWKLILEEYDYKLKFLEGKTNIAADYFSRNLLLREDLDLWQLIMLGHKNTLIISINKEKEISLWKLNKSAKYLVKDDDIEELIKYLHLKLGHPGSSKLNETIRRYFNIKNLRRYTNLVCYACLNCQRSKQMRFNHGELKNFIISNYPFEIISSDILGPLQSEFYLSNKKFFILTITDIFTRYTKIYHTCEINSIKIVKLFIKYFQEMNILPKKILTDQGRQYTSKYFYQMCMERAIRHHFSTTYTPTANSISERINSIILNILRIYKNEASIIESLKYAERNLNFTLNRSSGQIPYETLIKWQDFTDEDKRIYLQRLYNHQIKVKSESLKKENKKRIIEKKVIIGCKVMIKKNRNNKLEDYFEGPYEVVKIKANDNLVAIFKKGVECWVSIRNLRIL